MQEVRHVLPAIDHLAHLQPGPGPADAERIAQHLEMTASSELRTAFLRWCERARDFRQATARLEAMRESADGAAFQRELEREIEAFRSVREELFAATDRVHAAIVQEIDAPPP